MREHRVGSGEVELAVREWGGEPGQPTVILIHGYPGTAAVWTEIAERLDGRFHVVAYDVRGAGGSSGPAGSIGSGLSCLVGDLAAIIDAVSPDHAVHVVGHDWGALQGWAAVTDPRTRDRIASFTSVGGVGLDHLQACLRQMCGRGPADVAAAIGHLVKSSCIGLMSGGRPHRPGKLPPQITTPVQFVVAARGRYLVPELVKAPPRRADKTWVRQVPAGHWSPLAHPDLLSRWITEFTGAVAAATPLRSYKGGLFDGQLVVVTGAGSGIGQATAYGFAANGACVIAADIDEDAAKSTVDVISGRGGTAYACQVDVADADAMERFAVWVRDTHGVPDVVVNNAGIGIGGSLLDTAEDAWAKIRAVNLDGVYRGCRLFGRQMAERGQGGHLVNMSSMAAFAPTAGVVAYAATKAAVLQLSECLRLELAGQGIGVSAICPGAINTPVPSRILYVGVTPEEAERRRQRATKKFEQLGYPAEKVASAVMRAVVRNRPVTLVAPDAYIRKAASRISPAANRAWRIGNWPSAPRSK